MTTQKRPSHPNMERSRCHDDVFYKSIRERISNCYCNTVYDGKECAIKALASKWKGEGFYGLPIRPSKKEAYSASCTDIAFVFLV